MAAQVGSRVSRVAVVAGAAGLAGLMILSLAWGPARAQGDPQEAAASGPQSSPQTGTSGEQATDAAAGQPRDASDESGDSPQIDPMSVNAACYVCHMTFIREELSKQHLPEKITCIDCHGLSAAHANDENIGATPPDVVFKRDQVDASCEECHEEHDVPATKVVARFIQRKLADPRPICTDCHGTHKIERAGEDEDGASLEQPRSSTQIRDETPK
jgi:hypothetical protein